MRYVLQIGLAAGVFGSAACREAPAAPPPRPAKAGEATEPAVRVMAARARAGQLADARVAAGRIEPWQATLVVAQVGGTVVQRKADTGQRVHAGDVLYRLDSSRQRLAVEMARTALVGAEQDVAFLTTDLERKRQLAEKKALATLQVDAAAHQLERARIAADRAGVQLRTAERNLADTTLRAPHDGIANGRRADVGDTVGPGSPMLEIVDLSTVRVRIGLNGAEAARMVVGSGADVVIHDLGGEQVKASVRSIAPRSDPRTGLFEVELTTPNPEVQIRAGMVAEVVLPSTPTPEGAVLAPRAAIFRRHGEVSLFEVTATAPGDSSRLIGRVQRRNVVTGRSGETHVEVLRGVADGALIVTSGLHALADGTLVEAELAVPTAPATIAGDEGG